MRTTQEQWEKACARADIPTASGYRYDEQRGVACPTKVYPPIGDPATVLKMVIEKKIGISPTSHLPVWEAWPLGALVHSVSGDTLVEAIVLAVLALPEAGE